MQNNGRLYIRDSGHFLEKIRYYVYNLKPVMQNGRSYIRDSGHFLEKIENISSLLESHTGEVAMY